VPLRLGDRALDAVAVRLRRERVGAANAGRKVIALIYAMALGRLDLRSPGQPRTIAA
jgi:hypothetical protein